MKDKITPLMRQYNQIKAKHPDTILLFRMGDFFETFNEDAVVASKVCGLTLTKRHNGSGGESPLAGFPHHQLDSYLPKLVRAGLRVAVCEQLEDPKLARGIVKRDVVEVVTPGIALYDKLLDTGKNNYAASIFIKSDKGFSLAGLAVADISTGEFLTGEFNPKRLPEILEMIAPAEIIISKEQKDELKILIDKIPHKSALTKLESWNFDESFGREALLSQFNSLSLKGFGMEQFSAGLAAAGAMLYYIKETQIGQLDQIKKVKILDLSDYMILDHSTRRNLEITFSYSDFAQSGTGSEGTLISILDRTCSSLGSRLFKKWITRPLKNLDQINLRLGSVSFLFDNQSVRSAIRLELSQIGDLERLISKVCSRKANPRDVISIKSGLQKIPLLQTLLAESSDRNLLELSSALNPLTALTDEISAKLVDEPTVQTGTGNVIRPGVSKDLDEYIEAKYSAKNWLNQYQESERTRTGIANLKVGFNTVFGYYIEISKAQNKNAPDDYQRKQTLTTGERYITPELKSFEEKILHAEEKIAEFENSIFISLLEKIASDTEYIQEDARIIAEIDCLQNFAEVSQSYSYCKPEIDESSDIEIIDGRHPVVERFMPQGEKFNPNSTHLDTNSSQIHIITGPNMSGKSCYLRQLALIILLGQVGCFVPARKARFGVVDRIFTRVGAQDNINAGESTFLVEMQEAANIINNASSHSLILLDEIGRGTATFDGISIAWAITEHIHNSIGAKTLFATHYHELNELANRYDRIVNYKVEVIEADDKVLFTHRLVPGATDHSFGIHVAQMAGLPGSVIDRANEILDNFEDDSDLSQESLNKAFNPQTAKIKTRKTKAIPKQLSFFEVTDDKFRAKITSVDINNVTPMDALRLITELQNEIKSERE